MCQQELGALSNPLLYTLKFYPHPQRMLTSESKRRSSTARSCANPTYTGNNAIMRLATRSSHTRSALSRLTPPSPPPLPLPTCQCQALGGCGISPEFAMCNVPPPTRSRLAMRVDSSVRINLGTMHVGGMTYSSRNHTWNI